MERSILPPLGDIAFQLDPHWLLVQAGSAPTEETRDTAEAFAHDLASIQNLPTAKDAPAAEQIRPPRSPLAELFGIPLNPPDPTPPERSIPDGQD